MALDLKLVIEVENAQAKRALSEVETGVKKIEAAAKSTQEPLSKATSTIQGLSQATTATATAADKAHDAFMAETSAVLDSLDAKHKNVTITKELSAAEQVLTNMFGAQAKSLVFMTGTLTGLAIAYTGLALFVKESISEYTKQKGVLDGVTKGVGNLTAAWNGFEAEVGRKLIGGGTLDGIETGLNDITDAIKLMTPALSQAFVVATGLDTFADKTRHAADQWRELSAWIRLSRTDIELMSITGPIALPPKGFGQGAKLAVPNPTLGEREDSWRLPFQADIERRRLEAERRAERIANLQGQLSAQWIDQIPFAKNRRDWTSLYGAQTRANPYGDVYWNRGAEMQWSPEMEWGGFMPMPSPPVSWSGGTQSSIANALSGKAYQGLGGGLFSGFGGSRAFGGGLASTIMGSITGGGSMVGGIGSYLGGGIGSSIAGALTSGGGIAIGGLAGGALNAILPGVGALLGPLLSGVMGKLFGPTAYEQRMGQLGKDRASASALLNQPGLQGQWNALGGNVPFGFQQLQATAFHDPTKVSGLLDEMITKTDRLNQAMQRYGITWEELGDQAQQSHIDEMAKTLIEDFEVLTLAGADVTNVIEKMGSSVEDFVLAAIRTGSEVPAGMQPMIEKMIEMGLLTDENGEAFTSLEDTGLTFAKTMTQGFDSISKAIEHLAEALGYVPDQLDAITDSAGRTAEAVGSIPGVPNGYRKQQGEDGSTGGVPQFALGGYNETTGLALLHAGEYVISPAAVRAIGRQNLANLNNDTSLGVEVADSFGHGGSHSVEVADTFGPGGGRTVTKNTPFSNPPMRNPLPSRPQEPTPPYVSLLKPLPRSARGIITPGGGGGGLGFAAGALVTVPITIQIDRKTIAEVVAQTTLVG